MLAIIIPNELKVANQSLVIRCTLQGYPIALKLFDHQRQKYSAITECLHPAGVVAYDFVL